MFPFRERISFKVVPSNRDPRIIHADCLRDCLTDTVKFTSAARQEDRRRHRAIKLKHAVGNFTGQQLHRRFDQVDQLFGRALMRQSENVGIAQRILLADLHFQRFAGTEIDKQLFHQQLGHFIARHGSHCIPGDAAVTANRNIRRARANIHKHKVQQPDINGNCCIQGSNRLQREA